jgi:hypothetical protein
MYRYIHLPLSREAALITASDQSSAPALVNSLPRFLG